MRFRCDKVSLFEAMSAGSRASNRPSSSGSVKLELSQHGLKVSGRDNDLMIEATIEVATLEDGVAVVPLSPTVDLVRSLPDGAIEFVADDSSAVFSVGRSEFKVFVQPDVDPPFVRGPEPDAVVVKDSEFRDGLKQVLRAASKDDSRDVMYTGVLFSSINGGVRLVATDGVRLALRDIQGLQILSEETGGEVIVPSRALAELERISQSFQKGSDSIGIRVGKKDATFEFSGVRLTTRMIDEKFRDYRQILQPSYPRELKVDKGELLDALRRLRRMAREARDVTHLRMEMSSTSLELSVKIPQVGQATEQLDVAFSGEDFVAAFDPELLVEGVDAVSSDIARIEFSEPNRPACITNITDRDFQYLLMPIRIK